MFGCECFTSPYLPPHLHFQSLDLPPGGTFLYFVPYEHLAGYVAPIVYHGPSLLQSQTNECSGWIFFAIILETVDFPISLPVGDLSRFVKGKSERRAHQKGEV